MKRYSALFISLVLILSALSSCVSVPPSALPSIQYNWASLETFEVLIVRSGDVEGTDGIVSEYPPEGLILKHINNIPFNDVKSGEFRFIAGESPSAAYTMDFVGVYTEDGQKINCKETELSSLPNGRYVICVLSTKESKDSKEEKYLFSGIEKRNGLKYRSSVSIWGNGVAQNPMGYLLSEHKYKDGTLVGTTIGKGIDGIFTDDFDPSELSVVYADKNIGTKLAPNVFVDNIKVYDIERNMLKYSFGTLESLTELPRGEYLISYKETTDTSGGSADIKDYVVREVDCVFKLVLRDERFSYGNIKACSGDDSIHTLKYLVYTDEYVNGELTLCGDGSGYWYLKEEGLDHNDYPTLVLNGSVSLDMNGSTSEIGSSVRVLRTDFEYYEDNYRTLAELSELPAGEYLILFSEKSDTRNGDESIKDYWISSYDCLFKLVVPLKNVDLTFTTERGNAGPVLRLNFSSGNFMFEQRAFSSSAMIGTFEVNGNRIICRSRIYSNETAPQVLLTLLRDGDKFILPGAEPTVFTVSDMDYYEKIIMGDECVLPFSYQKDREMYKDGDPGVKTSGFVNTGKMDIQSQVDAMERAKTEVTLTYNAIEVCRDREVGIWRVTFYTLDTAGGCQSIYINDAGETVLIVYGE